MEKVCSPKSDMSYTKTRLPVDCSKLWRCLPVLQFALPHQSPAEFSLEKFCHGQWVFKFCWTDCRQPSRKRSPDHRHLLLPLSGVNQLQELWFFLKTHPIRLLPILYHRWWLWACKVLQHTFHMPADSPCGQIYHPHANWLSPEFLLQAGWTWHMLHSV